MNNQILFRIFLAIFFVSPVSGQKDSISTNIDVNNDQDKHFGLFESDELLEVTLRFDLSTYTREKPKKDYLKANITFHLSQTDSLSRDIKLRTRGEFRNRYCMYPPITLNFKKVDFGYKDLNKISRIKLVPECSPGGQNSNYVLREYLIYTMFNILTDTSFRVRLLAVNYIDTERKRKPITQYGFFIEPLEMVTKRTSTIEVKSLSLTQRNIFPSLIDRLAIFNYMIGNYDWGVPGQHNVKIIKPLVLDPVGRAIAIPYDFDWTGLVNPSYAIPGENVGIQNIRERMFVGICRTREVFQKNLDEFAKNKEAFYRVIDEFQYLNKKEKRDMIIYLDGFFDQMDNKSRLIDILLDSCKKL